MNIIAALFADGGVSPRHRKQRPVPLGRMVKNAIAISFSGIGVFLPAMFVFCDGDSNVAGFNTCYDATTNSKNPFGTQQHHHRPLIDGRIFLLTEYIWQQIFGRLRLLNSVYLVFLPRTRLSE